MSAPPLFAGIYMSGKAARTARAIEPARRAGWEIALRALNDVAPELADVTVSQGPGKRLENLNGLVELTGGLPRFVVLCDDDVEFVRGDVVELVAECAAAGFGLGQPAHAPGSEVSHPHTRVASRYDAQDEPTQTDAIGLSIGLKHDWSEEFKGLLDLGYFEEDREGEDLVSDGKDSGWTANASIERRGEVSRLRGGVGRA